MDRELWTSTITQWEVPRWPCPSCAGGTLRLRPKTFESWETAHSKALHDSDGWEPEWITYSFAARLECTNSECAESVSLIGSGGVTPGDPRTGDDLVKFFKPQHAHPMPPIIPLADEWPHEVRGALRSSFVSFWSNEASAANSVRVAVERLLDERCVRRGRVGARLPLHARITKFADENPESANKLMAIKWLGNTGSHTSEVTAGDLLSAYEVLEHVLNNLFVQRAKEIDRLAERLIRKHAPPKHRKTRFGSQGGKGNSTK